MREKEIWKDIEGFEGLYQVSNMGRVKSLNYKMTGEERILKPVKIKNDYLQVTLSKEGKTKTYLLHRIVAKAFCENHMGYKEVNHKDQNKENNCANNLEFCSRKYNVNYGTRTERQAEKIRGKKQSEEHVRKRIEKHYKPVFGINKVNGLIAEFSSIMEASRALGINHSAICNCLKGKSKSCGGYVWYYADTEE